ncbi:MAG: DNA-processing protein DprA [Leptonema sp. (in: bacteria)]
MSNQSRARIITALFFSCLPYRRKFLHFIKEKNKTISITENPWETNQNLLKYFFRSFVIEYAKEKTLSYFQKKSFNFDFVILWGDESYPQYLKEIYDPPVVLFCKSTKKQEIDLNRFDSISLVGTRKPYSLSLLAVDRIVELFRISKSSKNLIHNLSDFKENSKDLFESFFSRNLSEKEQNPKELATISGFAKGIDFRVHKASIFFEIPTIGVLGSGIDCISPKSSEVLFQEAQEKNQTFILVSEFFPTYKAGKYTFPLRNRIIAGMSLYLFLIQAGKKSGALISVDYALQENRDVFVFDHKRFRQLGGNEGGEELLQQGANLIVLPI